MPFFKSLGYTIPENFNPADFSLEVVSAKYVVSNGSNIQTFKPLNDRCEQIRLDSNMGDEARWWRGMVEKNINAC